MNGEVRIRVQQMAHARDLPLPDYATEGAAGLDLRAALDGPLELAPGRRALVPTGIRVAIPPGYEGQVRPRSGLAWRSGVGLPNAPGTIDSDYRGEVKVILINWSEEPLILSRGDRIAQLVIGPVLRAVLEPVEDLDATARESGGFGHTGTR